MRFSNEIATSPGALRLTLRNDELIGRFLVLDVIASEARQSRRFIERFTGDEIAASLGALRPTPRNDWLEWGDGQNLRLGALISFLALAVISGLAV